MDKEAILQKVDRDQTLTLEEERFYMTEILGMPADEVERIIAITENHDKNMIID